MRRKPRAELPDLGRPEVKQSKVPLARRAFTIAELCERNGLTPDIIRRLENEGRAPAVAVLARNARIVSLEEEQAWRQSGSLDQS